MDALIDEITEDEFNTDERLPYWANIWPSSIALSLYIVKHLKLKGKSLLELGCGLGLTSIVAASHGCSVISSDYETDALEFVKRNAHLNQLSNCSTYLLDWRKPDLTGSFDLIVAADILYEERFLEPVLNMLVQYLNANGKAIIAEPNRRIAQPFFQQLEKQGYAYQKFIQTAKYKDIEHDISIYEIN